jgi:type IV pilus assembly protein PilA
VEARVRTLAEWPTRVLSIKHDIRKGHAMRKILTSRRDDDDQGFTLIELMVVVLIIAILLAIAIPTFLGAQTKAKDRGAQSAVRNGLTAAKTVYADQGDYSTATSTALTAVEPAIAFVASTGAAGSSVGPKSVSVYTTATIWYGSVLSASNVCYYIRDSIDPATTPGTSYAKVADSSSTLCFAAAAPTGATWDAKW